MLRVVYVTCDQDLRIVSAVIRAADLADEVVVLDRGSTDETRALALQTGAKVADLGPEAEATAIARAVSELGPADRTLIIDLDPHWKLRDLPSMVHQARQGHDIHIVFKPWYANRKREQSARSQSTEEDETTESPDHWTFAEGDISAMALTPEGLAALAGLHSDDRPTDVPESLSLRVVELQREVDHRSQESLTTASRFAQLFHWMLASRHPLITFGVPGSILFALGFAMARTIVGSFDQLDNVSLGVALATFAVTIIGVFAMMTSLILYVLGKQIDKLPVYGIGGPGR